MFTDAHRHVCMDGRTVDGQKVINIAHPEHRSSKLIKWELSLLHETGLLVLLFILTKYYQIISNSMGVMACTRFQLQGRQLHKEGSQSCLFCTQHAYWSSSTFLPNIIKICLRVSKLSSAQGRVSGRTDGRHADRYIPWTYWSGHKKQNQRIRQTFLEIWF